LYVFPLHRCSSPLIHRSFFNFFRLHYLFKTRNHILSAALLGLSLHVAANGQTSSTDGTTPQYLTPGAPAGSYSLSEVESVSLFNGNLNFSLPLLGIGGRGTAGYTMTLPIEQKWQVWKLAETPPGQAPILTPIGTWWGVKPGYSLA
jgi:hypothetical protein